MTINDKLRLFVSEALQEALGSDEVRDVLAANFAERGRWRADVGAIAKKVYDDEKRASPIDLLNRPIGKWSVFTLALAALVLLANWLIAANEVRVKYDKMISGSDATFTKLVADNIEIQGLQELQKRIETLEQAFPALEKQLDSNVAGSAAQRIATMGNASLSIDNQLSMIRQQAQTLAGALQETQTSLAALGTIGKNGAGIQAALALIRQRLGEIEFGKIMILLAKEVPRQLATLQYEACDDSSGRMAGPFDLSIAGVPTKPVVVCVSRETDDSSRTVVRLKN
jgi:chaperonin cofactor prefoldin